MLHDLYNVTIHHIHVGHRLLYQPLHLALELVAELLQVLRIVRRVPVLVRPRQIVLRDVGAVGHLRGHTLVLQVL